MSSEKVAAPTAKENGMTPEEQNDALVASITLLSSTVETLAKSVKDLSELVGQTSSKEFCDYTQTGHKSGSEPIYSTNCGSTFSKRFVQKPITFCPECGRKLRYV